MPRFSAAISLAVVSLCANTVYGHVAAFHKGMYCMNGPQTVVDLNSYAIVYPLYQLSFKDWWFHGCMDYPPPDGNFIDLPAGGSFSVEIASNRAKTSLSYGGRDMSAWPDGNTYPEDYHNENCIISPNLHTQDRQRAAGTVFAISYESDIRKVTPENLVVFTVRDKTPWKRVVVYDVPAAMPACPPGGCICAWGWVPDGCGQPNMYHQAFKCRVSGATSTTPVGTPKPPVWCENDPGKCVKGPKQMIYWHQNERNNVFVDGSDSRGLQKSPGYNKRMGFYDGPQNDIFAGPPSSSTPNNPNNNGGTPNNVKPIPSPTSTPTNNGNSGNTPAAPSPAASTPPAVDTPAASPNTPNNTSDKPHHAPSCSNRRRRRGLQSGEAISVAKRSSLVAGITNHRRRGNHLSI